MKSLQMLVVNYGSQYTDLIGRSLRDLGVRSVILPPDKADQWLARERPKAVILSGSDKSVNDPDAPDISDAIVRSTVPILGICYGMQLLAKKLGGEVRSGTGEGNFGETSIILNSNGEDGNLWEDLVRTGNRNFHKVWASHGDVVTCLPTSFSAIAWSYSHKNMGIMAMASRIQRIWGVQFHPEVGDTDRGGQILANFVFRIAGCKKDWSPKSLIEEIRTETQDTLCGRRSIIGFSGGVDSTTLTALLAKLPRIKLHPVIVDAGNLREGEQKEIVKHAWDAGITVPPLVVPVADRFISAITTTIDAEEKRKIFRHMYREIFLETAKCLRAVCVLQGSLAPDFIESGQTGGATIVSHHNVGYDFGGLEAIHPFRNLFKYEVRELARELGLPASVCERQPFPGPGLFVRIVGQPVTVERLELVRWADAKVREILFRTGEYQKMSQLVVGLLCINIGGVKGDARSYKPIIGIRGIVTADFMTGRGFQIVPEVRRELTMTLLKHPEIGDVSYHEADKPPKRTEFE